MPVRPEDLHKAIKAIEKRYGEARVIHGSDEPEVGRISTGSLELDWAMGGGIPIGRISRLWGGYSSGKSLVCWNVIREAQQLGMTCAYYNIEKQYDKEYVQSLGVDVEKLLIVQGTAIEQIGTELEALLGSVHLHVLDSTTSAASIDELNAEIEQWQMGLNARAWGKVLSHVEAAMDQNENVIIMISQARETMGYGGGEHPPGGNAIEHASSMTVHFRKGGWLFEDENGYLREEGSGHKTLSGLAEADGFAINARVMKSRVGRPLRQASIWYQFSRKGFDVEHEYLKAAKYFGLLSVGGGWYKWKDSDTGMREAQFRELLKSDPFVVKEIEDALYGKLTAEKR